MKTLISTLAAVVLLAACGASEGNIYKKEYEPAKDWQVTVQDYITIPQTVPDTCYRYVSGYNGQPGRNEPYACTKTVMRSVWVGSHKEWRHKDHCYHVWFKNKDGDKGDDCTDKITFDEAQIGTYYTKGD